MRIPIVNTDSVGIITDTSPHDLPLSAWSAGRNVRMVDGRVEKMPGHKRAFTPLIPPRFLLPFQHTSGYFWLYASEAQVFAYQGGVHLDITREAGGYNAANLRWSGGVLSGVPILNVASEIPQAMLNAAPLGRMVNLPAWPTDWRALNIKPFGNYLVALGVNKGAQSGMYNVNWSHPAEPGTVPVTWDITDVTHDAGEYTLAETPGFLVDQLTMGDVNLIYKSDSVYTMQWIGGEYIFGFRKLFKENVGLLMQNGVASFTPPGRGVHHFVFAPNDIVIHDGRAVTPVFEGRVRKWLYNNLDSNNFTNAFVINNVHMKEIWVCFPLVGSVWANCALIWNYANDTISIRDLPDVAHAAVGEVTEVVAGQTQVAWSADTGSWDADTSTWGSSAYQPVTSRMLMGAPLAPSKTFVMDLGTEFEETPYQSFVERTGLTIIGNDRSGKPIEDSETVKLVTEIWIRAQGNIGTKLDVYVGTQDDRGGYPTWNGPYPFTIGVDKKINPLVSGRIVSVRFESEQASLWQLNGYDLNIVPCGAY